MWRRMLGCRRVLRTLPPALLAGGAQSVRGYSYNDLGPGTHLLEGSVEWQQRLYRNLYATAFIDAASIGSHWAGPTYSGAGPGLLLQTPIGALEVTAAKPLNNPQKSWMFQFSLTPNLHLGDDA